MVLTIVAAIVFLAHVAVWLGIPSGRVNETAPSDLVALELEQA